MKKLTLLSIFTFVLCISFMSSTSAQERKGARLEYTKEKAELGQIAIDSLETFKLEIEFVNEGDEPLVVSSVRGCCGTRIKDYSRQPVMPGEKGIVYVEFRLAPRPHNVNRRVSIMSNDERGMQVFRIQGEVVEKVEETFESKINSSAGPRVN